MSGLGGAEPGTGGQGRIRRGSVLGGGGHRGFGWMRRNRVPLTVIISLCVFSLIYTSYWITENTTRELPHLKESAWNLTVEKHLDPQPSLVVQLEHPPKIRCPVHKQDPFSPRMVSLFMNMTIARSNHSCADDPALGIFKGAAFHVETGRLLVRDVKFPDDVRCCLQVVTKDQTNDESISIRQKCTELRNEVNETTAIQPPTEIVLVTCKNSKSENYYTDAFQIFQEKPEVEKRIKTWQVEQLKSKEKVNDDGRLSVIVFGMDTVSQAHFERSMRLTNSYLENYLKVVKVRGYNKVCIGTLRNIMALLSGLSYEDFSSSCLTRNNRYHNCPFIWNTFASNGYRTAFFDEEATTAAFNLEYRNAFGDHPGGPSDYYGRPFTLLMERKLNFNGFCFGPRLSFQHLLDNVKTMADMFNSSRRPYFHFIWESRLTHDSRPSLPWVDIPLLEALKYLHENGHLNHTAVFLVADHGDRGHDDIYEAMIENQMPLARIVLPPWFSQRYPKAFENLRWNGENSVASPFDMYKTLQDMLDLDRLEGDDDTWRANRYFQPKTPEIAKTGQSLFEMNSQGRNCESAGIPPMWCICHEMVLPLEKDSFLAVSAAKALIEEVNRKAEKINSLKCERLRLTDIVNATVTLFNQDAWKKPGCKTVISNATSPAASSSSCDDNIYISVRIRASPHDPVFQTMTVRNKTGAFLASSEILREDWYSTKGHCVEDRLSAYCICKDFE